MPTTAAPWEETIEDMVGLIRTSTRS